MSPVFLLSVLLSAPPSTLVVFDVEDTAPGGTVARAASLRTRVERALAGDPRFSPLGPERTTAEVRRTGRQTCSFPLCQSEVVRALGADLGLAVQIFRVQARCAAAARFFDGLTRDVGPVAVRLGGCEDVAAILDQTLEVLLGTPPPVPSRPKPVAPGRHTFSPTRRAAREAAAADAAIAEGRLEAARNQLQACLRVAELPRCHRSLGLLEARLDHREAALRHYRRYLELAPDAPDANEVRAIVQAATQ